MSSSISLTNAVTSGDERAVSALLANGADVNESTSGGQTALILAVIFGHTNLVRILVKAGADPQSRDNLGLNAIEWAKRRGSSEALEILTNSPEAPSTPKRTVVRMAERKAAEAPPRAPAPGIREGVSDEKSRRWLAGLKQRLDEQEMRRLNRNEPPPEPIQADVEPPPLMTVATNELLATKPPVQPQFESTASFTPAEEPIVLDPPRSNRPLFWIMVVITLAGSIVVGSLITSYLYKSNQAARSTAAQQTNIQKGFPELSGDLVGTAVSLPEAECPLRGPEPLKGTVVVRVMVDKNGQVNWARGSGGDWLMRGASTEAAMKSTFSPEKLRDRETEGTITYTFGP